MAHSSFGPAWPNCDRSRIVTLKRADGLKLPIHRDLADLVAILMDLTELSGYDIKPGWTWGYACRAISGTRKASNHSQGTAVDINAPTNPRRSDRKLVSDLPRKVIQLWKAHGFVWGGDWSWPDPMHFEFAGTTAQARATAARLRHFLATAGGRPAPRPPTAGRPVERPFPGTVRMGDRGDAVRVWQQVLRERGYAIAVDGAFGPATHHVVVDWQRKHSPPLAVDGVAGPATWHDLLFR